MATHAEPRRLGGHRSLASICWEASQADPVKALLLALKAIELRPDLLYSKQVTKR
jgi:hypothetical protein